MLDDIVKNRSTQKAFLSQTACKITCWWFDNNPITGISRKAWCHILRATTTRRWNFRRHFLLKRLHKCAHTNSSSKIASSSCSPICVACTCFLGTHTPRRLLQFHTVWGEAFNKAKKRDRDAHLSWWRPLYPTRFLLCAFAGRCCVCRRRRILACVSQNTRECVVGCCKSFLSS